MFIILFSFGSVNFLCISTKVSYITLQSKLSDRKVSECKTLDKGPSEAFLGISHKNIHDTKIFVKIIMILL